MSCKCNFCKDSQRVKQVVKGRNRRKMRELIEELFTRVMCAEDEVNYHAAILDGSWPSAVEILEEALKRAKEKAETNEP